MADEHLSAEPQEAEQETRPAPHVRSAGGSETWDYKRLWSRGARVYFDTNCVVCAIETD